MPKLGLTVYQVVIPISKTWSEIHFLNKVSIAQLAAV